MDTGTTQTIIDYSQQLNAINENLIQLNKLVSQLNTMFYALLLGASVILLTYLFYRFLKIFI